MIIATNNQGKINEIKKIFHEYKIHSLKEKGLNVDVLEDQDTFLGNAKRRQKKSMKLFMKKLLQMILDYVLRH